MTEEERFIERTGVLYGEKARAELLKVLRNPEGSHMHPQDLLEQAVESAYPEQLRIDAQKFGALRIN